jgi:hypothetical protein
MSRPNSISLSTFHSTVENMSGIAEAVHFPLSTRLYKAWKGGKKPPVKTLPKPPEAKMQPTQKLGTPWCASTSQPKASHRGLQSQQWPLLPLSLITR